MITGIEKIARAKQKAVLEFITNEMDLEDAINIETEDEDIILINDDRYFVIRACDEEDLMDQYNDEMFEAAFQDLSDEQLKYVNKDQWVSGKGYNDFLDYMKEVLNEYPSEDYIYYGGYNFYLI